MSWQKIKFGTDGWRAIIAEDFTFENVALVSAAIAKYLDETYALEKPALISYDPRFLADKFALHAANVIAGTGRKVLIVDRDTPTPVIAYAAKALNSAGALQFTASHNPPEYCGLKYIPDFAGPADEKITKQIKEYVDELGKAGYSFQLNEVTNLKIESFSPKEAYLKEIESLIDYAAIKNAGLKIGYDALNGTGRGYLDKMIECKVVLGTERDPLFRGKLPEPIPATLGVLIQSIKEQKLDVGLSNDGDADRFAILDNQGHFYTPNQILCILAKYLYEVRGLKGAIVRTVATTHLLDALAAKMGLKLIETAVGFKHVGESMRQEPVLIGGEESGGLSILGHIPEKDGILACLLVCEALAKTGKSLAQLWDETTAFGGYTPYCTRLDLHLSNEVKQATMQSLRTSPPNEFAGLNVKEVVQKDGVKLVFNGDSWLLVRPSGTEPLLRVYLEAPSQAELDKLKIASEAFFGVTEQTLAHH
jgi:alpha-D-glucose phosphate-specific phosphoglucomutase